MTTIMLSMLVAVSVGVWQQPRDGARPVATGSARLSGIVVTDGRSPQPVRRAIVTITGSALGVSRSTITDDSGRFSFDALPAGRLTVTAARKAYLTSVYGAAYPGDTGTPINIAEAAHVDGVRITLPKGAVLTGVITDARGTPVPALSVLVFRAGEDRYDSAGEDVTDDRGIYRVYGLQPGDYIVAAAPRSTGVGHMGMRSEREVDALLSALERRGSAPLTAARPGETATDGPLSAPLRTYSFAQFYYPGTAVAAEAARITVAAGEERSGLDFTVAVVPTATISGSVMGSDGQPARDVQVSMVPLGPPVSLFVGIGSTGPARTGADGSFSRSSVTPGTYRVLARRNPPPDALTGRFTSAPAAGRGQTTEWAMTEITVNGDDIQGLALTMQPGLRVTGRIVFEGTSEIPRDLSPVRVTVDPLTVSVRAFNISPVAVKGDGAFELTNLLPGTYQIGLTLPAGVADRWWLRSATSGGRDVLDVPLELAAGAAPEVVFTLSDRRPSLSGILSDANGKPASDAVIVVFSVDRAHWRRESRRVRLARPGTDGRYEITDIPPGEYFVAAASRIQPGAWHQPAFLERLAAGSVRIEIGEGEQKTQALRRSR